MEGGGGGLGWKTLPLLASSKLITGFSELEVTRYKIQQTGEQNNVPRIHWEM